jgi:small conductance mechanosensitive channel
MFTDAWADVALKVVLIVVASAAAYLAIRIAVAAAVKHLIARRTDDADAGNLTRVELERRVTTLGQLLVRIAAAVIVLVATLMVLGLFNVDIGPAIAALGIAGLAVGFGAQTLIKDWLSGVFIVAENQFNAGEHVRIAGVEGHVEDFSLRRTVLRDADGTVHHVPNGQIIVASNLSRGRHTSPSRLGFGVSSSQANASADAERVANESEEGQPPESG